MRGFVRHSVGVVASLMVLTGAMASRHVLPDATTATLYLEHPWMCALLISSGALLIWWTLKADGRYQFKQTASDSRDGPLLTAFCQSFLRITHLLAAVLWTATVIIGSRLTDAPQLWREALFVTGGYVLIAWL